jgi:hypothetical protein
VVVGETGTVVDGAVGPLVVLIPVMNRAAPLPTMATTAMTTPYRTHRDVCRRR